MSSSRAVQVSIAMGRGENATFLHNIPPGQLTDLTHTRYSGEQGNTLNASFVDYTARDLETKLLFLGNAVQDRAIYYQYGYSYSLGSMSRMYSGFVYDYTPSIAGNVIKIDIMAVSKESSAMMNTEAVTYSTGTGPIKISDIVKTIAKKYKWIIGEVEETVPIKKAFINSFSSPMEFINAELIPYAISALTGNGFYSMYFTTNIRGETVINFKSMLPGSHISKTYSYIDTQNSLTYNTNSSRIISWSPTSVGSYLLWGGGFTEANVLIGDSGDLRNSTGQRLTNANGTVNKTWLSKNNYSQVYMSGMTEEAASSAVKAAYSKAAGMQYNAQCTLVGDVNRQVGETLEFNIILQNKIHYSSGRYLVIGVTDNINSSGFTTDLDLVKNASMAGDTKFTSSYFREPASGLPGSEWAPIAEQD